MTALKDIRICFVGDSFVNGTGDQNCLGWAGRICAEAQKAGHAITFYNLGIRRDTSADIRQRWHDEVKIRLPEGRDGRIVFSFGVNDTTIEDGSPRVEFAESIENARHILGQAGESFPILMVGPPPTADEEQNSAIVRLADEYNRVCAELGVPYLNVFNSLIESGVWIKEAAQNDGSHPRSNGYSKLAEIVHDWNAWQSWFK